MRAWIASLALLCATQVNADQTIFGPSKDGQQIVCADVNEEGLKTSDVVGTWILGFWSGLNASRNARVGEITTAAGVVGEVKLYCASHPSITLPQATLDTYAVMRDAHSR